MTVSKPNPLRVLIVSYSFPPVGGAGVQRVLKLCKYLPGQGVTPSVLTVKNPSVPVRDETLAGDLPPGMEVLRTRTLEPGYGLKQAAWRVSAEEKTSVSAEEKTSVSAEEKTRVSAGEKDRKNQKTAPSRLSRMARPLFGLARQLLFPDPQVLWQPGAQGALFGRLYRRHPDDVVLISGPPFSQFLLAPLSRLRPGVGVVLDYRDEWITTRSTYEMTGSRLAAALGDPLESALLRCAHMVTTATEEFRENLLHRFPFLLPARVHAIPNGYDPDDFPQELPTPPKDRFVLSYAGTLFKLTSPRGLLGAIRRLHRDEPALARLLEVRFMGRIVDTEEADFAGTEALGVRRMGYLDHHLVLAEQARSHLCLCLLDDVPGNERIYPGKIFELMYLRRPCLTLAPQGALTRLSARHQLGDVLPPRDEAAIAALLSRKLRAFRDGTYNAEAAPVDISRYHRRALAAEFARVMRLSRELASATPRRLFI